jgi:hypothetical protein
MSYVIYNTNGTLLTVVPDRKVNTSTSLPLVGRDISNYGQYINQNFVSLLGNFANTADYPPNSPVTGQLWWDTTYKKLRVYDGIFRAVGAAIVAYVQPVGQNAGEFWYDKTNKNLNFVDDLGQYKTITSWPRNTISGWRESLTTILDDSTPIGAPQTVTLLQNYGNVVGALSDRAFVASTNDSNNTFARAGSGAFSLVSGLTIIGDLKITGAISSAQVSENYFSTTVDLDKVSPGSIAVTGTVYNQNLAIANNVLSKLFPTTNLYQEAGVTLDSQARVLCYYSLPTSGYHVRRFYINGGVWTPYITTSSPLLTSVINLVR